MRIAVAATVSLLAGAVSGYFLALQAEPKLNLAAELVSCEAGNTGTTLHVLRAIRAGNAEEGVSLLEAGLSLHAVVLDEYLRVLQPADPSTAEKFLRAIAAYRSEYPFASGVPEADRNVATILASYSAR